MEGVETLVQEGHVPGGTRRNAEDLAGDTEWAEAMDDTLRTLLCDAQTSGGLLVSVAAEDAERLLEEFRRPFRVTGDEVPMEASCGITFWRGSDRDPDAETPEPGKLVREADLAMTELFGGFGDRFYEAYQSAWGLEPEYETRREIYNLYHLLNHLNLFGAGYANQVASTLKRFS